MERYPCDGATLRHPGWALLVGMCWLAFGNTTLQAQICQTPPAPGTPPCVLTSQYDNLRDAHNRYETLLTATGLSSGTVKLTKPSWSPLAVDTDDLPSGQTANPIYAQPLYVSQVQVGSAKHNLLIAVTLNTTIYAWDADNGKLLWKRKGTTGAAGFNTLYFDDCGTRGAPVPRFEVLPFLGILGTPVIDVTTTPARMYLVSACETGNSKKESWLHEINLASGKDVDKVQIAGAVPGSGDGGSTLTFAANEELQRPALLELRVPNGNPKHVIYVAYGTGVHEDSATNPYHGWVFGYTTGTGGVLSQVFAFATTPTSDTGNTGSPGCDSSITNGFQNAPNWCGHGAGIWMSGRGPAGNVLNGIGHSYFGVGNGGFQANGLNWGESVMDFQVSAEGAASKPSGFFTPYGGVAVEPPLQNGVSYTFQTLNENDWDQSVSGILLFDDPNGNHRAITVDKAGYGYVFDQENLGGFAPSDPGNLFPFGASPILCTSTAADCARIVSLAYYNNALYFWPNKAQLNALQYYNSKTNLQGQGTITSTGTSITGIGVNFSAELIAGDTLVAGGQAVIVTSVKPNALTVSPAFSPNVINSSYTYNGLFVNPIVATVPSTSTSGYPGGSLVITSNGTAAGSGVVWAIGTAHGTTQVKHGAGTLYVYDAATLQEIWTSPDAFTASQGALPTVVNGNVYIPTYDQGILVYTGSNQ